MTHLHWKYHPALKLAIPFAAGIAVARLARPSEGEAALLLAASLWLLALAVAGRSRLLPLILGCTLLASGALRSSMETPRWPQMFNGEEIAGAEACGRVLDAPVLRGAEAEFTIACDSLLFMNSVLHPRSRVLVRLRDTTPFDPRLLPQPGDHVSIGGTLRVPDGPTLPGGFDQASYLAGRGTGFVMTSSRAASVQILAREDLSILERLALAVKREVRAFAETHVGGEEGAIVRALLVGDRSGIDPETSALYSRTGTVHVLSVSGLHVGVIALLLFVLVSWIPHRAVQFLLFTALIAPYVLLTGAEAPILRSAIMAVTLMGARVAGRIGRPLNALGLAALLILMLDPDSLFDVGFQLSFASIAGIMLIAIPANRMVRVHLRLVHRWPALQWLVQAVVLSASAQIATLPIALYHFGAVSLIALVINIVVVPLYTVALGAALAGALAMPVLPALADCLGGSAALALRLAGEVVALGAALPLASVTTGTIGPVSALILGAAAVRLALSRHPWQGLLRIVAVGLALACVLILERAIDPIGGGDAAVLYILPWNGRTAAVLVRDASARLYVCRGTADSASQGWLLRALRRRHPVERLDAVNVEALDPLNEGSGVMIVNAWPREVAVHGVPLMLSATRSRPIACVRAGGDPLLQVPLLAPVERTIVLIYRGRWEVLGW
ncbi:MAG TPA: ComEC/Rec2 family competence protein [Candidatus Kapabacteria bacterium]|nr:ComEC/Rec2 family competence protein [Candidatus Kapabacteria bacterium]